MASIFDLMDDSNSNQPKISTADMKLFRAAASGDFATVSTMLQPNQGKFDRNHVTFPYLIMTKTTYLPFSLKLYQNATNIPSVTNL